MALPPTPAILWGTSFANTWAMFGAVDVPMPLPIARGAVHESDAGSRDWWDQREDRELTVEVIAIPKTATGGVTGYSDATTGVQEALIWLQRQNIGRWAFSASSPGTYKPFYLVGFDPERDVMFEKGGARRRVRLRMRTSDGSSWGTNY